MKQIQKFLSLLFLPLFCLFLITSSLSAQTTQVEILDENHGKKLNTLKSTAPKALQISNGSIPQGFNFQAVARGANGDILANTTLGVEISLLQGSDSGQVVYTESHSVSTDALGLLQIVIGEGETTDIFAEIDWSADNYYVNLAIDPSGGTTYEQLGTTRLLSVPYALVAKNVIDGVSVGDTPITQYFLNTAEGDTSFIINSTGPGDLAALRINAGTDGFNIGLSGNALSEPTNENQQRGIQGIASGSGTGTHLGVFGSAVNSDGTGGRRYGLYGQARSQGRENIGGFGIGLGAGDGDVVPIGQEVNGNFGGFNIGMVGFANGNLNGNIGIRGYVYGDQGGRVNRAVSAEARSTSSAPNFGVEAIVTGSTARNVGYMAFINGQGAPNIGMELNVGGGTSNVGIISNAETAGIFNGNVNVNGDLNYSGNLTQTSDRNLKENIAPIHNGISTIMKLQPSSYNYVGNGIYKGLSLSTGVHYGLIAQDVELVLPSLVKQNVHYYSAPSSDVAGPHGSSDLEKMEELEYKSVNYMELIPLLIKAVQEQQAEINQLKSELEKLKK